MRAKTQGENGKRESTRRRRKNWRIEAERLRVKTILISHRVNIADIANSIQRPRSTVSQAINHGRFPKVKALIEIELCKLTQPQPSTL